MDIKKRLANGALLLLKRNHEVPVSNFKVGFLGGLRLENNSHAGVTSLLSNTWTAGSRNFTEGQVAGLKVAKAFLVAKPISTQQVSL